MSLLHIFALLVALRSCRTVAFSSSNRVVRNDFWGVSVTNKDEKQQLPSREWDKTGRLPPGCYETLGNDRFAPRETCRIAIHINREEEEVSLQDFVEVGLTTFTTDRLSHYARFRASTPRYVHEKCNLMVPFVTPTVGTNFVTLVRQQVLDSIQKSGGEVDTLQIHSNDSPYLMDALSEIQELQHEGLVRATMACGWLTSVRHEAEACGLHPDSYAQKYTIFDSVVIQDHLDYPLFATNAVTECLWTDSWNTPARAPVRQELTKSNPDLRETLADLALQYRVSVPSVALRWILQQESVYSAQVDYFRRHEEKRTTKDFGDVFRFSLSDEDLERIATSKGEALPAEPLDDTPLSKSPSGLYLP